MNTELMENLQKARQVISLVERGERELQEQQRQLHMERNECIKAQKAQRNSFLIGIYLLGLVAVVLILYMINLMGMSGIYYAVKIDDLFNKEAGIMELIIFDVVAVVGYTACYIISVIHKKYTYKNARKELNEISEHFENRYAIIAPSNKELLSEISYIPKEYQYELAINFFCQVAQNGRAVDLKECMNLYEEQLHRWKVEQNMYQISQAQIALNARINAVEREARMADMTANFALIAHLF